MKAALILAVLCLLPASLLGQQPDQQQTRRHPRRSSSARVRRMYALCPPRFTRIENECYYFSPNKLNWLEAYFECKDSNAKLVEPMMYEDRTLRKYLNRNIEKNYYWIGGTYNWQMHKWTWGNNAREMSYQSFSQMVPGSSADLRFNCALLSPDVKYRWSAALCTKKLNFICQHRMPMVAEQNRKTVYSRWNNTFPNQLANEQEVYITFDPYNKTRSNDPAQYRIFNSRRRALANHSGGLLRKRQHPHIPQHHVKKILQIDYLANDIHRKNVVQYAPDSVNEINSNDNGHRNGNRFKPSPFNVDLKPKHSKIRPHNRHRENEAVPHQHRHQPAASQYRPTKTTRPRPTASVIIYPTTTTEVPTVPTERTVPTTVWTPPPTIRTRFLPETTPTATREERKLRRDRMRERLSRLSEEEQRLFFERKSRKQALKYQAQRERLENETVQ